MRRFIWPSLIWLLALALPIQGLAAATMVNCAVGHEHHGALPAAAVPIAIALHAHDAGVARQPHEHGAVASDHRAADNGVAPILHKCSACAACCMGLALPSAGSSAPELPLAVAVALPAPAVHAVAFLTGGPDRPPRALSA
jgi:hypothetical protein